MAESLLGSKDHFELFITIITIQLAIMAIVIPIFISYLKKWTAKTDDNGAKITANYEEIKHTAIVNQNDLMTCINNGFFQFVERLEAFSKTIDRRIDDIENADAACRANKTQTNDIEMEKIKKRLEHNEEKLTDVVNKVNTNHEELLLLIQKIQTKLNELGVHVHENATSLNMVKEILEQNHKPDKIKDKN